MEMYLLEYRLINSVVLAIRSAHSIASHFSFAVRINFPVQQMEPHAIIQCTESVSRFGAQKEGFSSGNGILS